MKTRRLGRIICRTSTGLLLLLGACSLHAADKAKRLPTAQNATDGARMVLIPGGSFLMGTSDKEIDAQFADAGLPEDWKTHARDEQPQHKVTVKAFYLYKYEVTNAQYERFTDATGHRTPPHWQGKTCPKGKGKHPVVEVGWDDAQAYCAWAGTRLPTEAQWEYAARGSQSADGQSSPAYPWGNKWDRNLANNSSLHAGRELQNAADWTEWYKGDQKSRYPLTSAVGSFRKSTSPFGIHDMAGNAWEWCAGNQPAYGKESSDDRKDFRARRGGSWANVALHLRSADRQGAARDNLNIYTGFRCVGTEKNLRRSLVGRLLRAPGKFVEGVGEALDPDRDKK